MRYPISVRESASNLRKFLYKIYVVGELLSFLRDTLE